MGGPLIIKRQLMTGTSPASGRFLARRGEVEGCGRSLMNSSRNGGSAHRLRACFDRPWSPVGVRLMIVPFFPTSLFSSLQFEKQSRKPIRFSGYRGLLHADTLREVSNQAFPEYLLCVVWYRSGFAS